MLGGDALHIGERLLLRLFNQRLALALLEPCPNSGSERLVVCHGNDSELATSNLGVVLLHGLLVRCKLVLNSRGGVARGALQISLRIGKLVVVQPELGFRHLQRIAALRGCSFLLLLACRGLGGELIDCLLVLIANFFKLRNLLL